MHIDINNITSLYFEITSYCNIRCPQCSRTSPLGDLSDYIELKHWDLDTILPNLELDKIPNLKHVHIEGDNGDAFMHPKIVDLLDHIVALPSQPVIDMLTNGSMRSASWWKELGQRYQGRLKVQFSIDGLADTNPLYRIDVDHEKVLANAQAFVEGGGEGTSRCIIFKHNQHQIDAIVRQARSIGLSELIFIPNDKSRFQEFEKWAVYDKNYQITHYIENTDFTDLSQYGYNETTIQIPEPDIVAPNESCTRMKRGKLWVTYKGHVLPCCMVHSDLYFDHPNNIPFREMVGPVDNIDVNQHKLSWIIDSQRFYNLRLNDRLDNGPALNTCKIFCPRAIKNPKSSLNRYIPIISS